MNRRDYLKNAEEITLNVLIAILTESYVESSKAIYWDGRTEYGEQVSSGTYLYQIETGNYIETRKIVF